MLINYKTSRLLPHLVVLGIILIPVGGWQIIVSNLAGIPLLITGLFLVFFRHGFVIDASDLQLKLYSGICGIKSGYWQDISTSVNLQIIAINESQNMSMLSINRTSYTETYKLFLILPNKNIELMSSTQRKAMKAALEIASILELELIDKTKASN